VLQEAFEARQASTAGSELEGGTLVSGSWVGLGHWARKCSLLG